MLKSLRIKNFTVFAQANLEFCGGLNVIVGENGVGKTHLLKLPYAVMAVMAESGRANKLRATKAVLQREIAEKLVDVMRPDTLGRLARRQQGRQRCEVRVMLRLPPRRVAFHFATNSRAGVVLDRWSKRKYSQPPVFLPTRELLSIYPGFLSLYDARHLEFEETWRDTCQLLGAPTLKGPREQDAKALLEPLEELMGGRLVLKRDGRFYLRNAAGWMEMPLVAEGVRKLAMLARLVATGALVGSGTLFWDEPEANLNPRLIKGVAAAILRLAAQGVQVIVATHDLFLLREFELLRATGEFDDASFKYFALSQPADCGASNAGGGVRVQEGGDLEDVEPLVTLDEALDQSDRYLRVGVE